MKFSKAFWERFGETILFYLFNKRFSFKYNFGFGYRDVRTVAKYWRDKHENVILKDIVAVNQLKKETERETVKAVMRWCNNKYPSIRFYKLDNRERWNKPSETLEAFYDVLNNQERRYTTDCDDYAILIYSLCRVAGVSKDNLYLCLVQTMTEYHMNVMYLYKNTPYAVEGTYLPLRAIVNFLKKPYLHSEYRGKQIYKKIEWIFNDSNVYKYRS